MHAGMLYVAFALPCSNLGRQLGLVVRPAMQALTIHIYGGNALTTEEREGYSANATNNTRVALEYLVQLTNTLPWVQHTTWT
jgi:hypothetical protein